MRQSAAVPASHSNELRRRCSPRDRTAIADRPLLPLGVLAAGEHIGVDGCGREALQIERDASPCCALPSRRCELRRGRPRQRLGAGRASSRHSPSDCSSACSGSAFRRHPRDHPSSRIAKISAGMPTTCSFTAAAGRAAAASSISRASTAGRATSRRRTTMPSDAAAQAVQLVQVHPPMGSRSMAGYAVRPCRLARRRW